MQQDVDRTSAEANRLYWESDLSVGEVTERLGISRRALYDAIRPSSAGVACTDCGTNMIYPGRAARDSGRAECPDCGLEGEIDLETMRHAAADAGSAMRREADRRSAGRRPRANAGYEEPEAEQERAAGALSPINTEDALDRGRVALIGGAAIAGAALGAAAVLLAGRRR